MRRRSPLAASLAVALFAALAPASCGERSTSDSTVDSTSAASTSGSTGVSASANTSTSAAGGAAATSAGGSTASSSVGGGASSSSASTGGAGGCAPVRRYDYALPLTVALDCVPGNAPKTVFSVAVPDVGRALVRVSLDLAGAGDASLGVHGWSGHIDAGDLSFDRIINFGAGEDLCPGEQLTRRMLGYGKLTGAQHQVSFEMYQYRSTACANGVVTVLPTSTMTVWVEDPSDACAGRGIVATSYFRTIWDALGAGANMPIALTTSFTDVLSSSIDATSAGALHVMSQLEISPSATSNQCGNRFETGIAALTSGGSYVVTETGGYPQSGGQTHLLLAPELLLPGAPIGVHTFGIAAAVNQAAQAGAPVGTTSSGDTVLAIVVESP